MSRFSIFCLFAIVTLAFALRFYLLGSVPNGLYQDETAIGYNAYSILKTGKDEHGRLYPLYFQSFGDWKLPIYIYSAVPAISVFGLTPFAVRLPSMVFGVLSVLAMYFFTKRLTKKENIALLSAFFLAITPWHLHYTRATFEVSICLFLYLSGGYFILRALQDKKYFFFLLGTLLFVINLYTYNLTRLLTPVIYLLFIFFFYKDIRKIPRSYSLAALVVVILGSAPFFAGLFGPGGLSSASGTLIHSSATIQSGLLEYRSYLLWMPEIFTKLFFNKWAGTFWVYLEHIASYFSVPFLFLEGSKHGNHGIGNIGQFYLFMLPFLLAGIYRTIVSKDKSYYFLLSLALSVILISALTREAPHATRSFPLLVPFVIFISIGLIEIYNFVQRFKPAIRFSVLALFFIISFYNVIYYFTSYYVVFPVNYAKSWHSEDKRLIDILNKVSGNYEKIVVDKSVGNIYTALLFYSSYPPERFHESATYSPADSEGFVDILSFDKYEFRDIDFERDSSTERVLFITTPENEPKNVSVIDTVKYPVRPVVAALGQEIVSYPVEDVAYVIAESK